MYDEECNKIGKSSAEYLSIYEWKNLESLTISCMHKVM